MQAGRSPRQDLNEGLGMAPTWMRIALRDYLHLYRGTVIGPLWSVVGQLLFVVGIAHLFSVWMNRPLPEYLPHVALGFVLWTFLSRCVNEGANTLTGARALINEMPLPLSFHIFRYQFKLLIALFVELTALVPLFWFYKVQLQPDWMYGGLGLLLIILAAPGIGLLVASCATKFRSFQPMVELALRFLFFFTPIIWHLDDQRLNLPGLQYNPFAIAMTVARAPLIGDFPPPQTWQLAGGFTIACWVFGLMMFSSLYRELPKLAVRS